MNIPIGRPFTRWEQARFRLECWWDRWSPYVGYGTDRTWLSPLQYAQLVWGRLRRRPDVAPRRSLCRPPLIVPLEDNI